MYMYAHIHKIRYDCANKTDKAMGIGEIADLPQDEEILKILS